MVLGIIERADRQSRKRWQTTGNPDFCVIFTMTLRSCVSIKWIMGIHCSYLEPTFNQVFYKTHKSALQGIVVQKFFI